MVVELSWDRLSEAMPTCLGVCLFVVFPLIQISADEWFQMVWIMFALCAVAIMFFLSVLTKPDDSIEARLARLERKARFT